MLSQCRLVNCQQFLIMQLFPHSIICVILNLDDIGLQHINKQIQKFYLNKQTNTTWQYKMGQMCRKTQKESPCSTISLSHMQGFEASTNFIFTVDKLTRITTQCLILFTDKKLKVDKNQFLKKCSKEVANKVQEYFDVALLNMQNLENSRHQNQVNRSMDKSRSMNVGRMSPGDCIIVDVLVPEFQFQKICIVCLQVWSGQKSSQIYTPLLTCLQHALSEIKQQRITSICITQFNSDYGIPNDLAQRILIKALHNKRQNLKQIMFITLNDQNMVHVKKEVSEFCQHISQNVGRSDVDTDSVYY